MEAIGMITINDISQYQEFCDFKKFKTKSFGVILKTGQGAWLDKRFEEFRNSAIQEGVAFGTYWFYDERFSPKEQAQLWANTIKNNPGVLGAWLSLEEWKSGSFNTWTHWKECMEEFKALLPDVILGIYTRKSFFNNRVGENYSYFNKHPLWVAHYAGDPQPLMPTGWENWTIWQYSQKGDGKAHGVQSDYIDMNRYNLDEASFKRIFGVTNAPSGKRYRVTANPFLFVREGPERTQKNIGSLTTNKIVEKIEENSDGTWYKVRSADGKLTGWCYATYLENVEDSISNEGEQYEDRTETSEVRTTNPAKGVMRIEGKLHGTRYYLTLCNPADVKIEVVHEDNRPSVIGKERGAKFAFNGDDWHRNTRTVKGTEICNGTVFQKRRSSEPSLIITKSGKALISHKNVPDQWNVTSGLRYLIEDGVNMIPPNGTELKYTERHARSIRGIHADGRVMFLTVDGDFVHKGMTLWEAAELMLKHGCVVAYDGGGGGDSVDVVDGMIANVPDDEGNGGIPVERKVPQTILVFTKE